MESHHIPMSEFYSSYKEWVSKNPGLVGDLESVVKWVSYFVVGKVNNATALSELVFALSNLLVFFNDRIIYHSRYPYKVDAAEKLKTCLTALEYSEVFIELSSRRLWGKKSKWIVAAIIQILKCAARLRLLFYYREKIIQIPAIPPIKRIDPESEKNKEYAHFYIQSIAFTLKRSGRVIRRIEGSPALSLRDWKPPASPPNNNTGESEDYYAGVDQAVHKRHLHAERFFKQSHSPTTAEEVVNELRKRYCTCSSCITVKWCLRKFQLLYIAKPLVHLMSVLCWGSKTWKPWMVALLMDLTSLQLYQSAGNGNRNQLSKEQRLEISRRYTSLFLYLMRSPFYEKYTQRRMESFLQGLGHNIPLLKFLTVPLSQYLPIWQDMYFYMWSS